MVIVGAVLFQDASAEVLKKCESAVYGVTTDDLAGMGFAAGGGKYLITCDHVIGSDSKITIHASKGGAPRHGYLVFHDPKLDVAVYRMDRVSPVSLKISTGSIVAGRPIYLIGAGPDEPASRVFRATIRGVDRSGERANVQFDGSISIKYSGSPLLNAKGEVVGMSQVSPEGGQTMAFGISGYSLAQFLRSQSSPAEPLRFVGKLGQVTESTSVYESASPDARVFFVAGPNQYLIVDDYDDQFLRVTLANGTYGYIRSSLVDIVDPNLATGTPGVANGFEVMRVLAAFDASTLHPTTSDADWLKECARFVGEIFDSSGRDISDDAGIQLDIGRDVATVDDLQPGDRIYFGNERQPRAAIFVGNNQYVSVSKQGKLVRSQLPDTPAKPFFKARH